VRETGKPTAQVVREREGSARTRWRTGWPRTVSAGGGAGEAELVFDGQKEA